MLSIRLTPVVLCVCTRVPEEKSYMILPEIEEEEEEGQKLSLTSLLLGDTHTTGLPAFLPHAKYAHA